MPIIIIGCVHLVYLVATSQLNLLAKFLNKINKIKKKSAEKTNSKKKIGYWHTYFMILVKTCNIAT